MTFFFFIPRGINMVCVVGGGHDDAGRQRVEANLHDSKCSRLQPSAAYHIADMSLLTT
jgi:hypothetical protein